MPGAALTPSQITALICLGFVPADGGIDSESLIAHTMHGSDWDALVAIVTSGILGLDHEGSITLDYAQKKRWGVRSSWHVNVTKVEATSYPERSIERELLWEDVDWDHVKVEAGSKAERRTEMRQLLAAKRLEKDPYVSSMARRWFGTLGTQISARNPGADAIRRVEAGLIADGWLVAPQEQRDKGPVHRAHHGKKAGTDDTVRPNSEDISEAMPQIVSWMERLTGSTATSELRPLVVKEVQQALEDVFFKAGTDSLASLS
jgi:hypothetical protein